jgi:hypothetical protein
MRIIFTATIFGISLVNADASAGKESDAQSSLRSPAARERKTKWNWDGDNWNWSWGDSSSGWGGPKPTKKPTSWDSSSWSSGNNPTDWVINGWGGDAWGGNGWNSWGSTKKPTPAPTSVCPVSGGNRCLSIPRQAILESKFGIPIDITDVDNAGYDKLENTFVQGYGFATPQPGNTLTIDALEEFKRNPADISPVYRVPISDFKCIDEVYALGVNACEDHPACTYFSVREVYGIEGYNADLWFWSQESVTAQTTYTEIEEGASVPGFPDAPRQSETFTTFIKDAAATPPDFSDFVCDVPPFSQTETAYTCFAILFQANVLDTFFPTCCGDDPPVDSATCQASFVDPFNDAAGASFTLDDYCLVTPDFVQYMAPTFGCFFPDVSRFQQCLQCVSKFTAKFTCNSGPEVCEEDDAVNFITAMPCEGGVQTNGCVCDACGHVCGTQCKAQIQTSVSCQIGSPFAIVENNDGDFVETGSCLNSQIVDGARDFSCVRADD